MMPRMTGKADLNTLVHKLHPLEIKVLKNCAMDEILSTSLLISRLGFKEGHANQAFSWLRAKRIIEEHQREQMRSFELTPCGYAAASDGTAEERMLTFLSSPPSLTAIADAAEHLHPRPPLCIGLSLPELAHALTLAPKDVGSAFGILAQEGILRMDGEKRIHIVSPHVSDRMSLTRTLLQRAAARVASPSEASDTPPGTLFESELSDDERRVMERIAKKRGASDSLFKVSVRERVTFTFTPTARAVQEALHTAGLTGNEIGALTVECLKSGAWKTQHLRRYNVHIPPARIIPGRSNAYADFLEHIKDRLVALGFQEFDGPLVETDFWNADALFMPQFHPARDIHDVYYLKHPTHAPTIPEPFLSRVAATHERGADSGSLGWRYSFDRDFTRRLLLRSQGTALSARHLPTAHIPGKYFGIARCFRHDQVDATHLADFYQTEGIVLGTDVNVCTLLGMLKILATEIAGAQEVRYVGGYFPFTEPSIELHALHPALGWFELGGAGLLRPEVTDPLGVHVPVMAWGLGVDRMALLALGISDVRELFSPDIESVRLRV